MSDLIKRTDAIEYIKAILGITKYYNPYALTKRVLMSEVVDAMQQVPSANPWHNLNDLPNEDCEVFTASRLPFDKTDTWIYGKAYFTTDMSECDDLKSEYPNEHKAAFYQWNDITGEYIVSQYGLKYWMPIEIPKEDEYPEYMTQWLGKIVYDPQMDENRDNEGGQQWK